jgi:O-antigen ligase
MEIWEKLISWNFWFNMRPAPLMSLYENILIGMIAFFLLATVLFFIKKKNLKRKKNQFLPAWRQLYYFSATNVVLGGLLWFFNHQMIPFFSSRFWFPVWFLEMIIWLFFIATIFKKLPERIRAREQKEQYNKYIP